MAELDTRVLNKLEELIQFGERVKQTRFDPRITDPFYFGEDGVDFELAHQWGTSCLNLLKRIFGSDSVHYKTFEDMFASFRQYGHVTQALGVLRAARDDYEQGFLFDARTLIEAEVFDDLLDQGAYLLNYNYYQAAAVVIGSVLENGLRKLCVKHKVSLSANPKLDSMNANLAKQGVYSKLVQKQITWLADIRNKAAHGEWDKFAKTDVETMLHSVRQFMGAHFI